MLFRGKILELPRNEAEERVFQEIRGSFEIKSPSRRKLSGVPFYRIQIVYLFDDAVSQNASRDVEVPFNAFKFLGQRCASVQITKGDIYRVMNDAIMLCWGVGESANENSRLNLIEHSLEAVRELLGDDFDVYGQ